MKSDFRSHRAQHFTAAFIGSLVLAAGAIGVSVLRAQTPHHKLRVALEQVERRLQLDSVPKLTDRELAPILEAPTDLDPTLRRRWLRVVRATVIEPLFKRDLAPLQEVARNLQYPRESTERVDVHDRLRSILLLSSPRESEEPGLTAPQRQWLADRAASYWRATDPRAVPPPAVEAYLAHAHREPEWLLPRDAELVKDVRYVLAFDVQSVDDQMVRRLEVESEFPGFVDAEMLVGTNALRTDGSIPGLYTRDAWESFVRDALFELSDESSSTESWVLGQVDRRPAAERLRSLRATYFEQYRNAWSHFLGTLRWEPPTIFDESYAIAESLSESDLAPLRRLVDAVDYHTQLIDGDPYERALFKETKPRDFFSPTPTSIRQRFATFVTFGRPPGVPGAPLVLPLDVYRDALIELQHGLRPFIVFGGNEEWHRADAAMHAFERDVDRMLEDWADPHWRMIWERLLQAPLVEEAICGREFVPMQARRGTRTVTGGANVLTAPIASE